MLTQYPNRFCQFGGHNSVIRRELDYDALTPCLFPETNNTNSLWLVYQQRDAILKKLGDSTMYVLSRWGKEYGIINELPSSFLKDPIRQTRLVQQIDSLLNDKIRKKLGNRFRKAPAPS